jgi:hypothetical protein
MTSFFFISAAVGCDSDAVCWSQIFCNSSNAHWVKLFFDSMILTRGFFGYPILLIFPDILNRLKSSGWSSCSFLQFLYAVIHFICSSFSSISFCNNQSRTSVPLFEDFLRIRRQWPPSGDVDSIQVSNLSQTLMISWVKSKNAVSPQYPETCACMLQISSRLFFLPPFLIQVYFIHKPFWLIVHNKMSGVAAYSILTEVGFHTGLYDVVLCEIWIWKQLNYNRILILRISLWFKFSNIKYERKFFRSTRRIHSLKWFLFLFHARSWLRIR